MRVRRIWIVRGVLVALPVVAAALVGELVLRRHVPACGVTPFRTATLDGLQAELRPSFETTYMGVPVRINAAGFRGPEHPPPDGSTPRVALIGDSFTFGNGVAWEDTLGARLAARLAQRGRPTVVLNCGVPGYTAGNARALLAGRVLALAPDEVVYVFFANDVIDDPPRHAIDPDSVIDAYHGFPLGSALLQFLGVRVKAGLRGLGLFEDTGLIASELRAFRAGGRERVREAVRAMAQECAARGVRLRVVIYPFLSAPASNPYAPIDSAVLEDCAALGVPCANLLGAFPEPERLAALRVGPYDAHPNGAANAAAAALLGRLLLGEQ